MKVIYDAATDVLRIVLRDAPVEDFNEEMPGVKVDYDSDDRMVAFEIRNASRRVDDPRAVEHTVLDG